MSKHLVLYDSHCKICLRAKKSLQKLDVNKIFSFSPLDNPENKKLLGNKKKLLQANTLILLENKKKCRIRGKAFFRIFWLLGGWKKWVGIFFFLPAILLDPFYMLFAKFRHW